MSQPDDDKTRTHVPLTSGKMVSHYRIIEKIGAGGMGEVYLAEDTKLDRKVALKFLPPHLCQDADCRARFKREAQAAAKLDHPNIVAVHEVGEFQGRPFFSMQHVEGQSLKEVIAGKTLPLDRIVEIGIQVCEGLQAAHENGITHRDIKPSNILIDSHGRARIVDFGLASVMGTDHLTKTGSTLGTIGYMSPEQVRGDKVDHRTDLFSFGVVLYEMITGHAPFKADSEAATLHAITDTKPELLARFRREIPAELQTIVDKALEKNVVTRYQHADDIATDLKRLSAAAIKPQPPRRNLWNRYIVTSAVAVILAIIGYLGVTKFVTKEGQKPETTRKTLAVLPFDNLSPDPDQEYFSDGLTEELTSKLSLVHSLCVISRSSSMTFKGSNKTIPEIARALNVQYVVEGSVRRAGNELRITAQLIDASADAHLWSKSYTGTMANVFDMQDSVSLAIVNGIKVQLTPEETRRFAKRTFDNPLAYEYWLRAGDQFKKGTEEAVRQGLQYLQQGLNILGDNALIYSGMSWGYWNMINNGYAQDEGLEKARDYAEKALELDPNLPEAHAMLGSINYGYLGNQRAAVEHFKKALTIDSVNEIALGGLMYVYLWCAGRTSAALPLFEKMKQFYPQDTIMQMLTSADIYFIDSDFEKAVEGYRITRQVHRSPWYDITYGLALAHCGRIREALSVIDSCLTANPNSSMASVSMMMRLALSKDGAGAVRQLTEDAKRAGRRDFALSYYLGSLLALGGEKEEALDWLENAANRGFINYPFWQKDSFLDSLRSNERFKKLMERVKYEWEHFEP